jgi:hypothetical protein
MSLASEMIHTTPMWEKIHDFEISNQVIAVPRRIRLYDKMTVVVNTQP